MNKYLVFDGHAVWMTFLKKSTGNHRVSRVTIAILHYFRDHPLAKNNTRGIAKWWVGKECEMVEKALAFLVKEGIIKKQRHVYQLAQSKSETNDQSHIEKTLRRLRGKNGSPS